jgi:hypothetical protein
LLLPATALHPRGLSWPFLVDVAVMPCLMAWPTLAMPTTQGAATQAALLGLVYLVDRSWAKKGLLPPWYMRLRLPLTLLAAAGLGVTAVGGH